MFLIPEHETVSFTYAIAPELKEAFFKEWREQTESSKFVLMPKIEAIHAKKVTRNFTYYTEEGFMQEIMHPKHNIPSGVNSWLVPFPKPVLKNHNTETEPLGRIASARVVKVGRKVYEELIPAITDSDAIEKILDGRYLTTSISSETDSITCSICKQDLTKSEEGFWGHEHERGEMYDDKLAYWIMGHLWHSEISFVNKPSDTESKIIQINTKESAKEKQYKLDMLGCYKDRVFNMETGEEFRIGEVLNEEESRTFYSIVESNKEEGSLMAENKEEKNAELESLKSSIEKLTAEKVDISKAKEASDIKIKELEERVQAVEAELNTVNEQLKEVETKNAETLVSLHTARVERLVDLKSFLGKAGDREEEIQKYSEKAPDTILSLIEELQDEIKNKKPSTSEADDPSVIDGQKETEDPNKKKVDTLKKLFSGPGRSSKKGK